MDLDLKQKICTSLFDATSDAILFADRDGIIRLWNAGAARLFGHTDQEAVGQSLDLIIPENLRGRHNDGYLRVMAGGGSRYGSELLSVPAVHKDGERLFSDFSIAIIRDERGDMLGVAAIMRDTTAQKKKEKELMEKLKALESQ